jgi:hypothetical protein
MLPWNQRSSIVANLFNPAFCALLLFDSINHYSKKNNNKGMPYSISYLILPIVLHKETRDSLPGSINSLLHPWIQKNPNICVGFAQRTRKFVSFTKEAIILGSNSGLFSFSDCNFLPGRIKDKNLNWESNSEVYECRKKAQFLGRWFSQVEDVSMIFVIFGVRP